MDNHREFLEHKAQEALETADILGELVSGLKEEAEEISASLPSPSSGIATKRQFEENILNSPQYQNFLELRDYISFLRELQNKYLEIGELLSEHLEGEEYIE